MVQVSYMHVSCIYHCMTCIHMCTGLLYQLEELLSASTGVAIETDHTQSNDETSVSKLMVIPPSAMIECT